MTARERKEKTELYLSKIGIPININLPPLEEENEVRIIAASDIAKRILILAYLGGYSQDGDKTEIIEYLKDEKLWDALSKNEIKLFSQKKLTKQDKINISWRSEGMLILLWAIKKIENTGLPIDQCNIGEILDLLPEPFTSSNEFIEKSSERTAREILDKADLIYRIHWATRQAELEGKDTPANCKSEILQEWHNAINWVINYAETWDDITTDT